MKAQSLERREFFKRVGLAGLAVAGCAAGAAWLYDPRNGAEYFRDQRAIGVKRLVSYRVARGPGAVSMVIARGKQPEAMVRAALGEMGGIGSFVQNGDVVLLKPNVAFDRAPLLGATTNPEVLKAVTRLCREAGARKIIVADRVLMRNGPTGGSLSDVAERNSLIVGTDMGDGISENGEI